MFNIRKWLLREPDSNVEWKHVVTDSRLGNLRWQEDSECWETDVFIGENTVKFLIAGEVEPNQELIIQAHHILDIFPEFQMQLRNFLNEETTKRKCRADEIRQLTLEGINFFWPKRPNESEVTFCGPDEFRLWRCAYINEEFRHLGFDD